MDPQYDVIVVGGGPAGLVAALFCARRGLRTLVLAKDIGGQLALTEEVENYPGVPDVGGRQLVANLKGQVERDGATIQLAEVMGIAPRDAGYTVRTVDGQEHATRTIILAFGLTPNDLGASGEATFVGKGISYSAVADAPPQDGKTIAVVGGGNSALTAVLELAPRAKRVYLVHRREEFRAEKNLLDRARVTTNVEFITPYTITEVRGRDRLKEMVLAHAAIDSSPSSSGTRSRADERQKRGSERGSGRTLTLDSVFVQIGYSAKTKWLEGVVALNAKREITIDRDCATNVPGIFAAGDITDIAYKQAVVSAGEGAKAALQVFKYLQTAAGKPAIMFDWDARGKVK